MQLFQINQQYVVLSSLGGGKYGNVYKGYSKSKNKIVAVKQLLNQVQKIWDTNQKIRRQVQVMKKYQHPNIIKLQDIIRLPNKIYLILQFCSGGDLRKYINDQPKQNQKKISQSTVFNFLFQIVTGMAEINRKGCFHRDLKPENIMISLEGNVKIGDFGFARAIIGTDITKLQSYTAVGSPIYAAPNVCLGEQFSGLCDVWSVGCIVYELLMGKNLFCDANSLFSLRKLHKQYETREFILKQRFHPFFKQFLPRMIVHSEQKRITFKQLEQYMIKNKDRIEKEMLNSSYLRQNKNGQKEYNPQQIEFENNNKKIKIITNGYKTGGNNIGIQTNQKIVSILLTQKYYKIINQFYKYIQHIYKRSTIFLQLTKRLNSQKNYPIQNIYKYLLMYTSLGHFLVTIDIILTQFKSKQFILPSGPKFTIQQLNQSHKLAFTQYLTQNTIKFTNQKKKYLGTVINIHEKIVNPSYKSKYPIGFALYPRIVQSLVKATKTSELESLNFYEQNYRQLMKNSGRVFKLQEENIIRVYNMSLNMIYYRELIDDLDYEKTDIISKFRQNFYKLEISEIKQKIKQFEKKLY